MKKKKLNSVRITLPEGVYYDALVAGMTLHGAPSLSKYIATAAMTYTKTYLEEKRNEIDQRK